MYEVHFRTSDISWGHTGKVRIWRSSGPRQAHRCKKVKKIIFSQCKTSIGNNSGSIEYKAMKFECSMGFLTTADRMLWPPSLSSDRKWPRVTKCTHSRVVGLRLEGHLVSTCSAPFDTSTFIFADLFVCFDLTITFQKHSVLCCLNVDFNSGRTKESY